MNVWCQLGAPLHISKQDIKNFNHWITIQPLWLFFSSNNLIFHIKYIISPFLSLLYWVNGSFSLTPHEIHTKNAILEGSITYVHPLFSTFLFLMIPLLLSYFCCSMHRHDLPYFSRYPEIKISNNFSSTHINDSSEVIKNVYLKFMPFLYVLNVQNVGPVVEPVEEKSVRRRRQWNGVDFYYVDIFLTQYIQHLDMIIIIKRDKIGLIFSCLVGGLSM